MFELELSLAIKLLVYYQDINVDCDFDSVLFLFCLARECQVAFSFTALC